ncbi:MAG: hypothetical protein HOE82_12815 [Gammaproteobacteria bacterium]|jgi:hypothetical protein|nr:hypothetical protein [Gammaproteobacteria bacterium]
MARTAVGAITIQDVQDGIHPISLVLSNQSHTFAGDQQGFISATEAATFSCTVHAYVGVTRATYDNEGTPANNTYSIGTIAYSPTGWSFTSTVTNNQVTFTMTTVPTGVTNKSCAVTVPIIIKNSVGNTTTVDAIISLSKLIEGSDGAIINLLPSRQTIRFDENDDAVDTTDILIPIEAKGNVGTLSAYYATNGSTSWTELSVGTIADTAKEIDIDGANDNDSITLSVANFGTADVFTVRVSGTSGGSDIVSIIKVRDGLTGPAALTVAISSSSGGFSFKNNAGTAKTLTAVVYDNADGTVVTPTAFQWRKNGTNVTGETSSTIEVTAADITDGGSEEYSCLVTTA